MKPNISTDGEDSQADRDKDISNYEDEFKKAKKIDVEAKKEEL